MEFFFLSFFFSLLTLDIRVIRGVIIELNGEFGECVIVCVCVCVCGDFIRRRRIWRDWDNLINVI